MNSRQKQIKAIGKRALPRSIEAGVRVLTGYFNCVSREHAPGSERKAGDNQQARIIRVDDAAVFSDFISLQKEIDVHHDSKKIVLDFGRAFLIDHHIMGKIEAMKREFEKEGRLLTLINTGHLVPVSKHPLPARKTDKRALVHA